MPSRDPDRERDMLALKLALLACCLEAFYWFLDWQHLRGSALLTVAFGFPLSLIFWRWFFRRKEGKSDANS